MKSDAKVPAVVNGESRDPSRTPTLDAGDNEKALSDAGHAAPAQGSDEFPEGGLQGWATVAGAFCIQFCGFGYTSSFGVYEDYYVRVYLTNETSSTISWIGSLNVFIVISLGLLAGHLFDRGHFRKVLLTGSFMLSFGLFMLSLAKPNQYYQILLSQSICAGIGAGLIYLPSIAVVSHYFRRRRILAMAIVATGSAFGSVIHPIMLNNTLHSSLGFGNSVRASTGLVTGMLIIANLLMRPRLPPHHEMIALWPAVQKFSRDRAYVYATLGMFFATFGFYYPIYYLQLMAIKHNLSSSFSFYSLVILNFCSFVGRLSSGFIAHRIGAPITITAASLACTAVVLGMIGVKDVAGVVCVGIFFGYAAGVFIGLNAALLAVLADNMGEVGARMGIAFAISGISGLVGAPICGALLGDNFAWWKAGVFCGALGFIGAGFFTAMCVVLHKRGKLIPPSHGH